MHTALSARLWVRRQEIEQAAVTRVNGITSDVEVDGEYARGLRIAVSAALDYGLDTLAFGDSRSRSIPAVLLMQARAAARNGVELETVLRRYFAGYALLRDFFIEEIDDGEVLAEDGLRLVLRNQAAAFDRLIAAVAEEHAREASNDIDAEQRRAERVQELLDGVSLKRSDFAYDFDLNHVGAVAVGVKAEEAMQELASTLDCRSLIVRPYENIIWGWFGARRAIDASDIENQLEAWPEEAFLAIGEPASGLAGWRFTHQQAQAALPIAQRSSKRAIRYGDVALLASTISDDLLVRSLHDLYLAPLGTDRNDGTVLRRTLRAYFSAEHNVSSAAAALGVSRQTVRNRLRTIEERLDRSLGSCAAEVDAALRIADFRAARDP